MTEKFALAFPKQDLSARLLKKFVHNFPRRFFKHSPQASHKYVFETLLLKLALSEQPFQKTVADSEFGMLTENVLLEIISHEEGLPEQVYRQRLAKGDICYYQKIAGELVSYSWISFLICGIYNGFNKGIYFKPLATNEAYTYDFYTYKKFRKKGYGSSLQYYLLADLYQRGKRYLFACVAETNANSLKIHLNFNYQLSSVITCFRLMGWHYTMWSTNRRLKKVSCWLSAYHQHNKISHIHE
jgi:GNAT superfamily N-acetyltransferase